MRPSVSAQSTAACASANSILRANAKSKISAVIARLQSFRAQQEN
jgi:hypothetical protein